MVLGGLLNAYGVQGLCGVHCFPELHCVCSGLLPVNRLRRFGNKYVLLDKRDILLNLVAKKE